jgi:hypothetical protein
MRWPVVTVDELLERYDAGLREAREAYDAREAAEAKAEEGYEPGELLEQFGTWGITTHGLECLTKHYFIRPVQIGETDWAVHMAEKGWVVMYDFMRALRAAEVRYLGVSPYRPRSPDWRRVYAR